MVRIFEIPDKEAGEVEYMIDWGDGSTSRLNSKKVVLHRTAGDPWVLDRRSTHYGDCRTLLKEQGYKGFRRRNVGKSK